MILVLAKLVDDKKLREKTKIDKKKKNFLNIGLINILYHFMKKKNKIASLRPVGPRNDRKTILAMTKRITKMLDRTANLI